MEGGRKTSIDLSAGLDVNTSDMLVPLSNQTFQHNWQKYQGKFLPNSLRFEKNGWAAGWNVFNFDYNIVREQVEDKWFEYSYFNANPTYTLNMFNSENSLDVVATFYFTLESEILNMINCDASLSLDTISVTFNDKRFSLNWDPVTEQLTLESDESYNLALQYTQNADKTWAIKVIDNDTVYDVDTDLYSPSSLTGVGLEQPIDYQGTTGLFNLHQWGIFSFDAETENIYITNYNNYSISDISITDNILLFNAMVPIDTESLSLNYITSDYMTNLNGTVVPLAGDEFNIVSATDAASKPTFAHYKTDYKKSTDEDNNPVITVSLDIPVWLTVKTEIKSISSTNTIKPNNFGRVSFNNTEYNFEKTLRLSTVLFAPVYFFDSTVLANYIGLRRPAFEFKSVFDSEPYIMYMPHSPGTFDISDFSATRDNELYGRDTYSGRVVNPFLKNRFNKIVYKNYMFMDNSFNGKRNSVKSGTTWAFNMKAFEKFRTHSADINNAYGNIFNIKSFTFNPSTIFNSTDWWTNVSFVYSNPDPIKYLYIAERSDISTLRSVKLTSESFPTSSEEYDNTDDTVYVQNYMRSNAFMNNYIYSLVSTPELYNTGDEYYTYDQVYSQGKYQLNSYRVTARSLNENRNFWPFEYVPCFNYKDSNDGLHTSVYFVSSDESLIIDNINDFKNYIRGSYNTGEDLDNIVLIQNDTYNITRNVITTSVMFDFDYDAAMEDYDNWKANWNLWYPETECPLDVFDKKGDSTYLDYDNININRVNSDNVLFYEQPSIVCYFNSGTSLFFFAIRCVNSYNVCPFKQSDLDVGIDIYHNSLNVNDNYESSVSLPSTGITGQISTRSSSLLNITSEHPLINQDGYTDYLIFNLSGKIININDRSFIKYLDDSFGWSNVYACRLDAFDIDINIDNKSGEKCWLRNLSINNGVKSAVSYNIDSKDLLKKEYFVNKGTSIIFAKPIYAHVLNRFKFNKGYLQNILVDYTKYLEEVDIPDDDTDFKYNKIYIDREFDPELSTNNLSYKWFKFNIASVDTTQLKYAFTNVSADGYLFYPKLLQNDEYEEYEASYYYPNIVDNNGNMLMTNKNMCQTAMSLEFDKINILSDVNTNSYARADNGGLMHTVFRGILDLLSNISFTIGEVDRNTQSLTISFFDNDEEEEESEYNIDDLVISYNVTDKTFRLQSPVIIQDYYNADISLNSIEYSDSNITLPLIISAYIANAKAKFAKAVGDELVAYTKDSNTYTLKHIINDSNAVIYNYNMNSNKVLEDSSIAVDYTYNEEHDYSNIKFRSVVSMMLNAKLKNVVNNIFIARYLGVDYSVDVSKFFGKESYVDVLSTDISKPDITDKIGRINTSKEFQIIKQQWNTTTATENFWWVDDKHILELTDTSFIYKHKNSNEFDDWNGNRFTDIYSIPRVSILDSLARKYFVTNVYNSINKALFIVLKEYDSSTIEGSIYSIADKFDINTIGNIYFKLMYKNIGEPLNTESHVGAMAIFNTYSTITADHLLSQAEWSNTLIDNRLIIGCHLSNNLDQWAAEFDVSIIQTPKCVRCIQGYGYVGIQGDLTGGMLPNKFFSNDKGFNSKIQELNTLSKPIETEELKDTYEVQDISKINYIEDKVVGTPEKQWYITNKLDSIVSHLKYDSTNDVYDIELLPITNTYSSIYKSPSFYSSVMGDVGIATWALSSAFKFNSSAAQTAWNVFCTAIGLPTINMFNPRWSKITYLQQTFGQYAYVHYNSSESLPRLDAEDRSGINGITKYNSSQQNYDDEKITKAAVLSDEFTFDKQIVTQQCSNVDGTDALIEILFAAFAPAIENLKNPTRIGEGVNLVSIGKSAFAYAQNVAENVGGLAVTSIVTESSSDKGLTSKVAGIKSLDMFYSTSDKQNIYAGPGFVEHQFEADCVAQSVTDTHVEGTTQQVSFLIKAITMYQGYLTVFTQKQLGKGFYKLADIASSALSGTVLGAGGVATATISKVAGDAFMAVAAATESAYKSLGEVLDTVSARGITSETVGRVIHHSLTPETKHKYGAKNEVFMWPCWGVPTEGLIYTDETVNACIRESTWQLSLNTAKKWGNLSGLKTYSICKGGLPKGNKINNSSMTFVKDDYLSMPYSLNGEVPYYQASCYGTYEKRTLPVDMAKVEGVQSFLPTETFKNENIGIGEPSFAPSLFQDYIIDKSWQISQACSYGKQLWVTCKDTKVLSGPSSNMYINSNFCGLAAPYAAVEVKKGIVKQYMRPYAITPNTLAFNCTGYNTIFDNKLYHAFDGISYRIVDWVGTTALNKSTQTFLYSFQVNDRFKRSNKFPANEVLGNFSSDPVIAIDSLDDIWTKVTIASEGKGLEAGTIGEDKDLTRWAVPIFTEPVSTLPAVVKTVTAMPLAVIDGVTGLVTDIANNQTAYKAPISIDFNIGKNVYRQTEEYICSVETKDGVDIVTELVPSLGLIFLGSSPYEAFFYSKSTRCYYIFTGSNLSKMDMLERFRDIQRGYWDFVNQEVVMPCLMTFKRLNSEVEDKDTETDNIIVPMLGGRRVEGELPPPITTIFNDKSWYKCVSLPSGLAYQGPNRVIINRSVFTEYMLDSLKSNIGKWGKLNREKYTIRREYTDKYTDITHDVESVEGWTYNPFVLVTSALGESEDTDCLFEWVITFCWPVEMDLIYNKDNYACVNIMSETMSSGGKVKARPTHVFLTKELFTRNGNYGYYSFRYQSKNGAGNRERLHIWSDQYIAISSIDCESKVITSKRSEQLTQQIDVMKLKEL